MDPNKEFEYIQSLKEFIYDIRKKIKLTKYKELENILNESSDDLESLTDLSDSSENINLVLPMNSFNFNVKLDNSYKELFDYTYSKVQNLRHTLEDI